MKSFFTVLACAGLLAASNATDTRMCTRQMRESGDCPSEVKAQSAQVMRPTMASAQAMVPIATPRSVHAYAHGSKRSGNYAHAHKNHKESKPDGDRHMARGLVDHVVTVTKTFEITFTPSASASNSRATSSPTSVAAQAPTRDSTDSSNDSEEELDGMSDEMDDPSADESEEDPSEEDSDTVDDASEDEPMDDTDSALMPLDSSSDRPMDSDPTPTLVSYTGAISFDSEPTARFGMSTSTSAARMTPITRTCTIRIAAGSACVYGQNSCCETETLCNGGICTRFCTGASLSPFCDVYTPCASSQGYVCGARNTCGPPAGATIVGTGEVCDQGAANTLFCKSGTGLCVNGLCEECTLTA